MITDTEFRLIRAAISAVCNRETDHEEMTSVCSVDRDENGGITIVLDPGGLDLEPEQEPTA